MRENGASRSPCWSLFGDRPLQEIWLCGNTLFEAQITDTVTVGKALALSRSDRLA